MDAWQQARDDIDRIIESRHAPHATRLYVGRVLEALERRLQIEHQQREHMPPAMICRTCGQRVES